MTWHGWKLLTANPVSGLGLALYELYDVNFKLERRISLLSTILTLQDLERSRSLWPHVGGPGVLFMWGPVLFMGHVYCSSGPAYYSSGAAYYSSGAAYKIYLIIFYIKNNMILYTKSSSMFFSNDRGT